MGKKRYKSTNRTALLLVAPVCMFLAVFQVAEGWSFPWSRSMYYNYGLMVLGVAAILVYFSGRITFYRRYNRWMGMGLLAILMLALWNAPLRHFLDLKEGNYLFHLLAGNALSLVSYRHKLHALLFRRADKERTKPGSSATLSPGTH